MEKSMKSVEQIKNACIIGLFVSLFLSIWLPVFSMISSICCCCLYISSFIEIKLKTGKINWLLFMSCILAVGFVLFNAFYSFKFSNTLSIFFVYFYLNLMFKIKNKEWNKWFVCLGIAAVFFNFLQILFDKNWILFISLFVQIYFIIKYLDPYLEKIALDHRAKRLAAEQANNSDETIDEAKTISEKTED